MFVSTCLWLFFAPQQASAQCAYVGGGAEEVLSVLEGHLSSADLEVDIREKHEHWSADMPDMVKAILNQDTAYGKEVLEVDPSSGVEADDGGYEPVHWAAVLGAHEFIKIFAEAGSITAEKLNVLSKYPALHIAVMQHKEEAVLALLEAGADINLRSALGLTPLIHAVDEGDSHLDMLELLAKKGASVNVSEYNSRLRIPTLGLVSMRGNFKMAKLLLDYGAPYNQTDSSQHTPLIFAAASCYPELVDLFLEHYKKNTKSPEELAELLNFADQQHKTALTYAVSGTPGTQRPATSVGRPGGKSRSKDPPPSNEEEPGRVIILNTLMAAGATLAAAEQQGQSLLLLAKRKNYGLLAELLIDLGVRTVECPARADDFFGLVKWGIQKNHSSFVVKLLQAERYSVPAIVLFRRDFLGRTLLELALNYEVNMPSAEALLKLGATVDLSDKGKFKILGKFHEIEKERGLTANETKWLLLVQDVDPKVAEQIEAKGLTAAAMRGDSLPVQVLQAASRPEDIQAIQTALHFLQNPPPPPPPNHEEL
eukprot:gb/GEZN01005900.1/.p1 GENE.gb/GEZN01005900.1/~~gb/GEZN01005900.1/.p1  ORF type:complete len:539 (+),score=103.14 gb/GEZN01005900.1/:20-1636(+)